MKTLCTGSHGFIGTHLMKLIPDMIPYDVKNISEENILDQERFIRYLKKNNIEAVVHLAAYTSVEESREHPITYIKNNVYGTALVIEAAIKAGVKKIVYASSSSAYEPSSTPYAFSKYAPEILLDYYKDQINTVALRFFNIYGQGQNPNYAGVIPLFIKGINEGKITIYGDGEQTRDFITVEDICRGIKAALDENIPSGEVIDLGTGMNTSINALASLLGVILTKPFETEYLEARKEVKHSCADTTKMRELLNIQETIPLEKGLRDFINGTSTNTN